MTYIKGSARRVAKQIMDFKEERILSILSTMDPDFKKEVLANIIRNRIERGRRR